MIHIHGHPEEMQIGIDGAKAYWVNHHFHFSGNKSKFAYNPGLGIFKGPWGATNVDLPSFNNQDILTIKLTFNNGVDGGILSVKQNNGQEIIASSKVFRLNHLNYRLVVSISNGNRAHILPSKE